MPRIASITNQAFSGLSIERGTPEASYDSIVLDSLTYDEGDTITATLVTSGVNDDVTVAYTVTGVSANDISTGSLSGTLTISSNSATATWTLNQDGLTEGTDTFVITLAATDSEGTNTGQLSTSATINDTSFDPTATLWLDDNDDEVTVRQVIGGFSMQLNGVFATDPSVPVDIEGRVTGTTTTVTNITANTGTYIEVDDTGNSTSFQVGESLNLFPTELVTNGDFSTGDLTGWTVNGSMVAQVISGELDVTDQGSIVQSVTLAPNTTYRIQFDVVSSSGSTNDIRIRDTANSTNAYNYNPTGAANVDTTFTTGAGTNPTFELQISTGIASDAMVLDNFSITRPFV